MGVPSLSQELNFKGHKTEVNTNETRTKLLCLRILYAYRFTFYYVTSFFHPKLPLVLAVVIYPRSPYQNTSAGIVQRCFAESATELVKE